MMNITKDMIIGDILKESPDMAPVLMAAGNALHRMPVFPDGVCGGGSYGAWNRAGASAGQDQCLRGQPERAGAVRRTRESEKNKEPRCASQTVCIGVLFCQTYTAL